MPIYAEATHWARSSVSGDRSYTASWTIEMPPRNVFAKVRQTFYMEYGHDRVHMCRVQISQIRRRRPDDSDETVNLGNVPAVWDPRMTSLTYGVYIYNCQTTVACDLNYWE